MPSRNSASALHLWLSRIGKLLLGIVVLLVVCFAGLKIWLRMPHTPEIAAAKPLPVNFLWGVSSSAFQSEGGDVDSNFRRLNDDLVGTKQDPYGKSVDFRHRYAEDIALARDLGIKLYRIGISWARVEPKKGQIDEAELAYYDDVIKTLKASGIEPLLTLSHFDHPGWVDDQGEWKNPSTVDEFVSFTKLIAARYHNEVHWWLTFNEASAFIVGEIQLNRHKKTPLGFDGTRTVRRHLIEAHRRSYEAIHQIDPDAMVSSNLAWCGDANFLSSLVERVSEWVFTDSVVDRMDYIALDYYSSKIPAEIDKPATWTQDPPGIYRALHALAQRYPGKPLLIAENGLATDNTNPRPDGVRREDALQDTVYWLQRAHADGIDVIGYMVWSLTDNFEWGSYSPRFGLYTVNVLTDPALTRVPTAAVPVYRDIIATQGVPPQYRPVVETPLTR